MHLPPENKERETILSPFQEYIYLNPEDNVAALRHGIAGFIDYYNNRRCHQGIGHKIPARVYAMAA